MKKQLLRWQAECLERWRAHAYKGIVNVVTGAGKTILALGGIEALSNLSDPRPLKVKIVVPKTFLMYQWCNALIEELNIPRQDIGFFSGARKTEAPCGFMIYVINSARYTLARHIFEDIQKGSRVLLIADECHHYGSEENAKIFRFIHHIPTGTPFYALGLSATPYGKNYQDILVPALGEEIYRYAFANALKEGIINRFTVFNICVRFDGEESAAYEDLSEKLGVVLYQLKTRVPALSLKEGDAFFSGLEYLIKTSDEETAELAKMVLFLSARRKDIVYRTKSRISCVTSLVRLIRKSARIIIFGERIETAEVIFKRLIALYPNEVGLYHSKLPGDIRRNTLRQFENFEIRLLVSCKTLDEGLNVSETDVGIIVSSTGSRRQRIQRLGRVLRKKRQDRPSYFYYLYVGQTSEEDQMIKEMSDRRLSGLVNVVELSYDEMKETFFNAYYQERVSKVLSTLSGNYAEEQIDELLRNMALGLLTADWLLTEESAVEKIKTAEGKAEKNYYIAMFLLIKARRASMRVFPQQPPKP